MKINLGKTELIHFVGIGGIGMSGLALIMIELGFKIQGTARVRVEIISEESQNIKYIMVPLMMLTNTIKLQ